jgi:spore maturation protein CgeB
VRYPEEAKAKLARAGIGYQGWIPNYRVPEAFSRHRAAIHIPRKPYTKALPGIPTIRVFEALACGIPLISSGWDDVEGLFSPGRDFLMARTPEQMKQYLRRVVYEPEFAREIGQTGLKTILARHTCAHRADELLAIAGVRQSALQQECSS